MPTRSLPPRRALAEMLVGSQVQQALYVAARLGIADLLKDGPRPSEELARESGAHPTSLYRLLRALAAFGVFREDEYGRFLLTPIAALLQSGTPDSMRSFALWSGGVSYQTFGQLEHSVGTGSPAFERLFGMEFFSYLAVHRAAGTVFDEMMAQHTAPVAPAVAGYCFSGIETVVDLGGGSGELLATVLGAHPTMRGVLVDQPRVLERARGALERAGVADRCTTVCADISQAVPPGDAYILKSVVHGLSDVAAAGVLANCRRALSPGGLVLLVEFVIPHDNAPHAGKLMDLLMLVGCHGRERTAEEFRTLLASADLRLTNITPAKLGYSIIEGRPF